MDDQHRLPPTTIARTGEVARAFLALGLTAFGGPVAHLAHFRRELVERRRWISEAAYAELVAYCQFLPGPTSSQVGFLLGWQRAGLAGALAAWSAFTLPSAVALATAALAFGHLDPGGSWLAGMKAAVLAVVAQAVLGMRRSLCPDAPRASIAAGVAGVQAEEGGVRSPGGRPGYQSAAGALGPGAATLCRSGLFNDQRAGAGNRQRGLWAQPPLGPGWGHVFLCSKDAVDLPLSFALVATGNVSWADTEEITRHASASICAYLR